MNEAKRKLRWVRYSGVKFVLLEKEVSIRFSLTGDASFVLKCVTAENTCIILPLVKMNLEDYIAMNNILTQTCKAVRRQCMSCVTF